MTYTNIITEQINEEEFSMDDLISRKKVLDALGEEPLVWNEWADEWTLGKNKQWHEDRQAIMNVPSVQTFRRRGHWEITDCYPHNVYCSVCHARFAQTHWAVWEDGSLPRTYCPNCGACMKREQDDSV